MSVPIASTPNPFGAPRVLFEVPLRFAVSQNNNWTYAASPDGQRFFFMTLAADNRPSLDVLLNWAGNQSR